MAGRINGSKTLCIHQYILNWSVTWPSHALFRDFVLIELFFSSFFSLSLSSSFSFLSHFVPVYVYIYIHIYMDKEVHCTFRCVVVFSGWTCLVANSVKRWKAALTSSVIGKTLTRYSGLLWQCFRYLPKKKIPFHVSSRGHFDFSIYCILPTYIYIFSCAYIR